MPCGKRFGAIEKRLKSYTTTLAYEWYTGWMVAGTDAVDIVIKQKAAIGNLQVATAIEYTAVRADDQGAGSQLDNTFIGPGSAERHTGALALSGTNQAMFRLGVAYSLTTGSALGEADVSLEGAYLDCGEVVATWEGDVMVDASADHIIPLGGFIPWIFVSKFKFVSVVNGVTGNIISGGVYRTADKTIEAATAWKIANTDWTSTYNRDTGAGEFNSTEKAPNTGTTDMYIQPGFAVSTTSGTGRAHVQVMVIRIAP
jgi:hypothetical protein